MHVHKHLHTLVHPFTKKYIHTQYINKSHNHKEGNKSWAWCHTSIILAEGRLKEDWAYEASLGCMVSFSLETKQKHMKGMRKSQDEALKSGLYSSTQLWRTTPIEKLKGSICIMTKSCINYGQYKPLFTFCTSFNQTVTQSMIFPPCWL